MSRLTNARLAGAMFLLYIVVAIAGMVLYGQAARGDGPAAVLSGIAAHESAVRWSVVLTWLTFVIAVTLGVTLYALTRDQNRDLALIALCCRVSEGVIGAVSGVRTLALVAVAGAASAAGPDAEAARAVGAVMLKTGGQFTLIGASCFAVASTIFAWLFLRGRSIPVALAGLGLMASVVLVVGLPLQIAGVLRGSITSLMWIPMAAFEVPLGVWLLVRGVREPARSAG